MRKRNRGYLTGETSYIFSVVSINAAENLQTILYVTLQQQSIIRIIQLGEFIAISRQASAMKEIPQSSVNCRKADQVSGPLKLCYVQLPRTYPR